MAIATVPAFETDMNIIIILFIKIVITEIIIGVFFIIKPANWSLENEWISASISEMELSNAI